MRATAGRQSPGTGVLIARFRALSVDRHARFAVIDAFGPITFAELWRRAYTVITRTPPVRPGAVQPLLGRPTADMIARLVAAWLTDTVPMPIRLGTPPATVAAAVRAAASTGRHDCGPWLAHLTSHGAVLLGGAPPTSHRTAAAFGLHPASSLLLGADPAHPLAAELAIRQLVLGGTVVLAGGDPDVWRSTLDLYRPTVTLASSELIRRLRHYPHGLPASVRTAGTLRRILVPAEITDTDADWLTAAAPDITVTAVYHRPGVGTATSTLTAGAPAAAVFTAVAGTVLRVAGPNGRHVPAKRVGLLEASSHIGETAHHAGQPCTPAGTWRTAGDLATTTADGGIVLCRLPPPDTYTAADGQRITVAALTAATQRLPGVAAVHVLALPDPQGIVRAHLRVTSGRPGLNAAAVATACAAAGTPIPARAITITRTTAPASSP
ncbi:hypothetical protein GCM10010170_025760 [Dactylosporangium salmoneum]|uniref:Uncharacterized protein n=1 Tax=Dactylosporangium salmoneum TaxID=53361 RepID=A0ABN3G163_9ACTN